MKIYKYVAMLLIALLTTYYFSCQCNNPTTEEPEPEPTATQPDNPQSGDPTPSAVFGPGKHNGIQRRSGWNTCYMNSALQILFALYGDLVKSHCAGTADGTMTANMLKLFNKVTNVDGSAITDDEIKNFYASMKAEKAAGGIKWHEDFGNQADSSELFTAFLALLNVPSIEVTAGPAMVSEAIVTFPFHVGSVDMQALIDQNTLNKVTGLYNDIFIFELGRIDHVNLTKNTSDIGNPFNITIKKTKSDMPADREYKLISFIHHDGGYTGGHYIAYIKEGAKWICYNDSNVSEVSDAQAETEAKKAYVFFYQPK